MPDANIRPSNKKRNESQHSLIVLALLVVMAKVLALEGQVVRLGAALVQGDQQIGTEIAVAQRQTRIGHLLVCCCHDVYSVEDGRGRVIDVEMEIVRLLFDQSENAVYGPKNKSLLGSMPCVKI